MNKEDAEKIKDLKREYADLEYRIKMEENKTVSDSVKGSSREYPYIQHSYTVEGIRDSKKHRKYLKMLRNKKREIDKKIINFEYQLNYVKDSDIRTLLRYKYVDGLTNNQIAQEMNKDNTKEYTEDSVRMQIKRFFEKK